MFVLKQSTWRPTSSCEEALNSGNDLEISQLEDLTADIED